MAADSLRPDDRFRASSPLPALIAELPGGGLVGVPGGLSRPVAALGSLYNEAIAMTIRRLAYLGPERLNACLRLLCVRQAAQAGRLRPKVIPY